jgi:hypothetical protein
VAKPPFKNKKGSSKSHTHLEPDGRIRTSQIITTYGPGAMVDLVHHAVLIGGLNHWKYDVSRVRREVVIREPRLRESLASRMSDDDPERMPLNQDNPFRLPPTGDENDPTKSIGIPAFEFPAWFVCQNTSCRALVHQKMLDFHNQQYRHECRKNHFSSCVPVRFVMVCKKGHLQDMPWRYLAHSEGKQKPCPHPELQLEEGSSVDYTEISVVCKTCKSRYSLSKERDQKTNPFCQGNRPWLGPEAKEECDERLWMIVRTASNAYFSQIASALTIPDATGKLAEIVDLHWEHLNVIQDKKTLKAIRNLFSKVKIALRGYETNEILNEIENRRHNRKSKQLPVRTAEFVQLMNSPAEIRGDLPVHDEQFFARKIKPAQGAISGISDLILAYKLREVRVQTGFTRLEPGIQTLQGEFDLHVRQASLGFATDWLPACEIRGEGIFLCLDEERIQAWEQRESVLAREAMLEESFKLAYANRTPAPIFPGIRFYLLHSLSHLLLTALSLECGYPASSIRERIYCAPSTDPVPMAAILLLTGTPGTEGTLGGLIEQGRVLRRHLRRAWDLGVLCSNDPVCSNHDPSHDPTGRYLEGAACHGCLFVAECSCERFNRYLDRALVVPTLVTHDLAFFQERP